MVLGEHMKRKFPWYLGLYSIVGTTVLRCVISDNTEWAGASLLFSIIIGAIAGVLAGSTIDE